MERALALGACGIQIFTNVDGRPLDDPELFPVFAEATTRHKVRDLDASGARRAD